MRRVIETIVIASALALIGFRTQEINAQTAESVTEELSEICNPESADEYMEDAYAEDEYTEDEYTENEYTEDYADSSVSGEDELLTEYKYYLPYDGASYELEYYVMDDGTICICGCRGEKSGRLVIPRSIDGRTVTTIGGQAFNIGGYKFTGELVIPDTITEIKRCAFSGCSGLTGDLTIPGSVKTIGSSAFDGCHGFDGNLIISDGVTTIGYRAFAGCSGFTGDLTIPDSVTSLGEYAFEACKGFNGTLTIGNNIEEIPVHAFYCCSKLTGDLIIPGNVSTIGFFSFGFCDGFTGNLIISDGVTKIEGNAFYDCTGFGGELTLGDNIESIGVSAFSGCSGLTGDLVIPDSVTELGGGAFNQCSGFNGKLVISENLSKIGDGVFSKCSGFPGDLTIPDNIISIERDAFSGCSGFTGKLTLPAKVTSIGNYAFDGCSGLTGNLEMPDTVTSIGIYAFMDCSGFTGTLIIPEAVTSLEYCSFYRCAGFEELTLPEGITKIASSAFSECYGLKRINNSSSVSMICRTKSGTNHYWMNLETKEQIYEISNGVAIRSDYDPTEYIYCRPYYGATYELKCFIQEDNTLCIAGYRGTASGRLVIPDTINALPVTHIRDNSFTGGSGFSDRLMLPAGLISADTAVFSECTGIRKIINRSSVLILCPVKKGENRYWTDRSSGLRTEKIANGIAVRDDYCYEHRYECSINFKGIACARFLLEDNSGNVLMNQPIKYIIDGKEKSAVSDEDGYVTVETDELIYDNNGSNRYYYDVMIYKDSVSDDNLLDSDIELDVTVEKLSFTQNWKGALNVGANGSIGASVGASAGVASAEASIAEATIGGSLGGIVSVENEIDKGERNLTIAEEYSTRISIGGKAGPVAEIKALSASVPVDLAKVEASLGLGVAQKVALTLKNYDPANKEDAIKIGKFIFGAGAYAAGNPMFMMIAEKLGCHADTIGTVVTADSKVGIDMLSAKVNEKFKVSAFDAGAGAVWEYSSEHNLTEKSNTRSIEVKTDANMDLLAIEPGPTKLAIIGQEISKDHSISTKIKDGKLQKVSCDVTVAVDNAHLFENEESVKQSVYYDDADVLELIGQKTDISEFSKGDKIFIGPDEFKRNIMTDPRIEGKYKGKKSQKLIMDVPLSFKLKAGLGLGIDIGLKGVSDTEYSFEEGIYYPEEKNCIITSRNNIKDIVNEERVEITDILLEANDRILDEAGSLITEVKNGIGEKISYVTDKVGIIVDEVKSIPEKAAHRVIHVLLFKHKEAAESAFLSYDVYAYDEMLANDEEPDVASTIGLPYRVWITDENGDEVNDFSDCPITIRLTYTDELLTNAGYTLKEEKDLAIYRYSEDMLACEFCGGTVDTAGNEVALEITEPGLYILAINNSLPAIKNFLYQKGSDPITVSATIECEAGIEELSLSIDDEEAVTSENFRDHYSPITRTFTYTAEDSLPDGLHSASLFLKDRAGKVSEDKVWFFIGDVDTGDILKEDIPSDGNIHNGLWIGGLAGEADYTGAAITPSFRVYDGIIRLRESTDYTVKVSDNVNAGDAVVTVNGKGNYSGTEKTSFKINPRNLEDEDVSVSKMPAFKFTKNEQKPVPEITFNKKKLTAKSDFTPEYFEDAACSKKAAPKNAGKYYIKVMGKGNFTGSIVIPFVIASEKQTPVSKLTIGRIPDQPYNNGGPVEPLLSVKDGSRSLSAVPYNPDGEYPEGDCYIVYRNNTAVGTASAEITGIEEKGYAGTRTVTFKIIGTPLSKAVIDASQFAKSVGYTGDECTNILRLKDKASQSPLNGMDRKDYDALAERSVEKLAVDYVISYEKNVDAGTANMILTGVNGWTGTVKKSFTVSRYDIAKRDGSSIDFEITDKNCMYSKSGAKPEISVTFDGKSLREGTDYTVTYSNNTTLGAGKDKKKPTVKITGKGNFTGSREENFTIVPASFSAAGAKIVASDVVYKNKDGNWKTAVNVVDAAGKKLAAGKDYTVRFTAVNDKNAGAVNDKYRASENSVIYVWVDAVQTEGALYTGSLNGSYRICQKDIGKLSASLDPKTYTGKPVRIKPGDITWKEGGKKTDKVTFVIDEDSYEKNIDKGTASVTVYGTGDYGGSKKISFTIGTKGIRWWWNNLLN